MRDSGVERLIDHAEELLERGHSTQAIDVLTRVLGEDPDNATAHALLAISLLDVKRPHAAELEAHTALSLDPDSTLTLLALVSVQVARQQFRKAESGLIEIIQRDPESAISHAQAARLYLAWGKLDQARISAAEAVHLAPSNASFHALDAAVFYAIGVRHEAQAAALRALALDPEQVEAIVIVGFCDLAAGRVAAAREHAVWALHHAPSDESVLRLLCAIKARSHPLLGAWWRLQTFLSAGSQRRMIALLISLFLMYQITFIAMDEAGHQDWLPWLSAAWLSLCAYTWIAPGFFWKSVHRELRSVTLRRDY